MQKSLLFAAWYTAHIAVLLLILRFSFPKFDSGRFVEHATAVEVLRWVRVLVSPFPLPSSMLLSLLMVMLLITALAWVSASAFISLLRRWSFEDSYELTKTAVIWSIRNYFLSGFFLLSVALGAGFAAAVALESSKAVWIAAGFLVAVLVCIPFSVLNKRVLVQDRVAHWYRFAWPRAQTVSILLLGIVATLVLEIAINFLPTESRLLLIVAGVLRYVVVTIFIGVLVSVAIYELRWRDLSAELRVRTNSRFLVAWMLLDVRFGVIGLWIAPPILVVAIASIFVVPQLATTLELPGVSSAVQLDWVRAFARSVQWFSTYWSLVGLFVFAVFTPMVLGKFLLLVDEAGGPSGRLR